MKIKIIKFDKNYKIPVRAHYNDAGADVFTLKKYIIEPHQTVKINLGFGLEIPDGYMGCIYPKSGLSSKGIIANLPPIDSGYRGEIHAIVTNTTDNIFRFNKDEKVGQLVITPVILTEFVEELNNDRGIGGFGSTGN